MQAVIQNQQNTTPLSFIQTDFSGGMSLYKDDTKITSTEYREAFYVRNRKGTLAPVTEPNLLNAPAGLKQGIYGFDTFFVLFVVGKAYYQFVGSDTWVQLVGFQMSVTAPIIYAQAVPASTVNYGKALANANNFQGTNLNTGVNLLRSTTINGLPAGLVCQDGINQPWIIFPDKTSRLLNAYADWTIDDREYVPIGKQMAYMNAILIITAPDGLTFYRSVSGRPIDFGVNIDVNGQIGGDATTVSYAVSFNPITCLLPLNSGQLFVGTTLGCFPIDFNYNLLVFGEPTFSNISGLVTGCVNQFSIQDILGDYAIVDVNALVSFNAVQQLKNEGRNVPFSLNISNLLVGVSQDSNEVCTAILDNYLLVSCKTNYGNAFLVYDTINKVWVSIDILPEAVKMLTVTNTQTGPRIFGISDTNCYEFYPTNGGSTQAFVSLGASITSDCKKELKTQGIRCVFARSNNAAKATIREIVDESAGSVVTLPLKDTQGGINYSVEYPVYFNSKPRINNLYFNFEQSKHTGWKIGAFVTWGNLAELTQVQIDAQIVTSKVSTKQQDSAYAN